MATILKVGLTNLHYTKEGCNSAYYIGFLGIKQMHSKETLPHPQNQYHITGARRLHICDSPGFKYGLLYHQVGPGSVRDVHNHLSMGQILL